MLRFCVYSNGKLAKHLDLAGAYLVGSDGVPVRADLAFKKGEIHCSKRAAGPVGLAILWPVPGVGRVMLETTRLPDREQPYILQLELARGRLMRLSHKQEDWELEDSGCSTDLLNRVDQARDLLIKALQSDDGAEAARLGDQSLASAVSVAEELSRTHAGSAISQRRTSRGFSKRLFGCRVDVSSRAEQYRKRLVEGFDFVDLPFIWREIEPREQQFNWKPLDEWIEWLAKNRMPIKGSELVSFNETCVPDWLYIWEHDFDAIRDLLYEHLRRIFERYGQYIQVWDIITGLHATNAISFNFEQLMELTRMAGAVTKQMSPRSTSIVNLVAPWGEYYARNQRTIPPNLYAEMTLQSGINFDAFGLQFLFGAAKDGMYVRDMFQISSMVDRFAARARPLHISGVQVPSGREGMKGDGGAWHGDWNEDVQKDWLRNFYEIALSKPTVDTITWGALADNPNAALPQGGLLRADLSPKPAYKELLTLRKELLKS